MIGLFRSVAGTILNVMATVERFGRNGGLNLMWRYCGLGVDGMAKGQSDKHQREKTSRPLTGECQLPGVEALLRGTFGRPTVYRDDMCDIVVELGRKGYSKAMIAADERIDVTRETLDEWCKVHSDFSDSMKRARDLALAWWEAQGTHGIWSRDFNDRAYRLQMINRFRGDWRDVQESKLSGDKENPVQVETSQIMIYIPDNGRD